MKLFQKRYMSSPWILTDELSLANSKGESGISKLLDHGVEIVEGVSGDIEISKYGMMETKPENCLLYGNEGPLILPGFYDNEVDKPYLGRFIGIDIDQSYLSETIGKKIDNAYQAGCCCCYDYETDWKDKSKFICLFTHIKNVNNNKYKEHNLYGRREEIILKTYNRFKDKFDFYGPSGLPISSFKGPIYDDREFHYIKLDYMCHYKFSICLENSSFKRYITEKIMHSLTARSIPVYLGAPDIDKYVPENLFINISDFDNYGDCLDFICDMSEKEIDEKISNIDDFVNDTSKTYFIDSTRWADEILKFLKSV